MKFNFKILYRYYYRGFTYIDIIILYDNTIYKYDKLKFV